MTQMAPILMQIPGINPEWLARQMLNRMDDRSSLDDALSQGVPSIMAMNALARGPGPASPQQPNPAGAGSPNAAGPGGEQPSAQGPAGMDNAPRPAGNGAAAPHAPPPRPGTPSGGPGPMMN